MSDASTASSYCTKHDAHIAGSMTTTSPLQTNSDLHVSFDSEDYDKDVVDAQLLQPIGTCIALYQYDGNTFLHLLTCYYVPLVSFTVKRKLQEISRECETYAVLALLF